MNHEEMKRALAEKATPGPWDSGNEAVWKEDCDGNFQQCICEYVLSKNAEHIAFHDPDAARLEAEAIAALRAILDTQRLSGDEIAEDRHRGREALFAIDAHHAKRYGGRNG